MVSQFKEFTSCGIRFVKPLDELKFDSIGYILTLFENYEKGLLPFSGAVSDQPGQIMEIFLILNSIKRERAEMELKKHNEQIKRNGRHKHKNQSRTR